MPSAMAVLPTPGSPMSTGIVLGAPRQHLHHAPDLFVATDDRVDLPPPRESREIPGVLVEGLKLPLGILIGDPLATPYFGQRTHQLVVGKPVTIEDRLHVLVVLGRREHEVLDGNVLVLEVLGLVLGLGQKRNRAPAERRLAATAHLGQLLDALRELLRELLGIRAGFLHQRSTDAVFLLEHRYQQVLGNDLRDCPAGSHRPRRRAALLGSWL